MDWAPFLIMALIGGYVFITCIAVSGSVDAFGRPREAWGRAGFRRNRWIWQALGLIFIPVALIYSGLYFSRVRPRLDAVARESAAERAAAAAPPPVAAALPGRQADRVTIRIPLSVVAATSLLLFAGAAAGLGLGVLTYGSAGPLIWRELSMAVGYALLAVVLSLGFGVTLTPRDMVVRGLIRSRVAWPDIVAITQESMLGARYVRLWTRSGRGRRLRAPITSFGVGRSRFDADFAVLQQWWWAYAPATN